MAHKSLYRAWRPERFEDVSGQDHIVRVLTGEIKSGRISHAYLFTGPRGTGKTSLAKIFAKAVNCTARQGAEPCGQCAVCQDSDNTTDIIEIDAASNNGVDSVRDLRDRVGLLPAMCRYKVYIIDEVHMLSAGAFNALLKTLEEPPSHVIFILATTEPHKLPATIRSRCQRFDFKRLPVSVMVDRLKTVAEAEGFKCSQEALVMIARAAEGGMRDALSILDQCSASGDITAASVSDTLGGGDIRMVYALAERTARYDEKRALEQLRVLIDAGADTRTLIKDLADIFRRMMWIAAGAGAEEQDKELAALAESFGKNACVRALGILIRKEYEMRLNLRADIVLETALMEIMCPEDDAESKESHRLEKLEGRLRALEERGVSPLFEENALQDASDKPARKTAAKKASPQQPAKKDDINADSKPKQADIKADLKAKQADIKADSKPKQADDMVSDIWERLLESLKEKAYFIYTYAQKAKSVSLEGARLELRYHANDAIAADYMKHASAQKALSDIISGITGQPPVISVTVEEKKGEDIADLGVLSMFGTEIEEI